METLLGLAILIASSSAIPEAKDSKGPELKAIYRLIGPANVLVEYAPGKTASAIQPHLFLRALEPLDPTTTLICRDLQNDYTVFFLPQPVIPTFLQKPVSKTIKFEDELSFEEGQMPWIIFLKKENTLELPGYFKKINLKSGNSEDPWELGAYTIAPPGSEVSEYPEDAFAAPPPFFPSLCVSPDKPKPFPVLFAPSSTQSSGLPSLASFSLADLTPAVAPTVSPAPALYTVESRPIVATASPAAVPGTPVVVPVPPAVLTRSLNIFHSPELYQPLRLANVY